MATSSMPVDGSQKVTRSVVPDLMRGILVSSRLFRVVLLTGISVGSLFLLYSAPPAWMIAAVAGGAVVTGILIQLPFKGYQKMSYEVTSLVRQVKGDKYNKIFETTDGKKIFLGSIPNRVSSDGERLANKVGVQAVLSINEPWERKPVGLNLAYQARDWHDLGVEYKGVDVLDHTMLSNDDLNKAADFIRDGLRRGDVYVHCRAGAGRSAMAVAAYLIREEGKTVDVACDLIKDNRSISTIMKKKPALQGFYDLCHPAQ